MVCCTISQQYVGGLPLAVKYMDQEELTDALRKLRQDPILRPEMRFC